MKKLDETGFESQISVVRTLIGTIPMPQRALLFKKVRIKNDSFWAFFTALKKRLLGITSNYIMSNCQHLINNKLYRSVVLRTANIITLKLSVLGQNWTWPVSLTVSRSLLLWKEIWRLKIVWKDGNEFVCWPCHAMQCVSPAIARKGISNKEK